MSSDLEHIALTLNEKATLFALACRIVKIVESDSFADEALSGARGTDDVRDYGQVFTGKLAITRADLQELHLDQAARAKCRTFLAELQQVVRPAFLAAWPRYRFRHVGGPCYEGMGVESPLVLTFRWDDPERRGE